MAGSGFYIPALKTDPPSGAALDADTGSVQNSGLGCEAGHKNSPDIDWLL